MFAQRFFRPIQDLSEKFNILQSAMAASERIFKLLDEPLLVESDPTPFRSTIRAARLSSATCGSATGTSRSRPRKIGFARCLFPSGAWAAIAIVDTPALEDHSDLPVTALLRHSARAILLDGKDIRMIEFAGFAAAIRHRAGRTLFSSPVQLKRTSGWARRASTAPQWSGRWKRLGLGNSYAHCRREWVPA